MKSLFLSVLFIHGLLVTQIAKAEDNAELKEQLQEYLDFADFADGVITPQVLSQLEDTLIVDTRTEENYKAAHIPNSIHIEWRSLLENLDQLPQDKKIVVYCDTGVLSSKAHLMLRLMGYENSRVLFGGFNAWQQAQK